MKSRELKILVFVKGKTAHDFILPASLDTIDYHDARELPIVFDKELYTALLFILNETSKQEIDFFYNLRQAGNAQTIYVICRFCEADHLKKLSKIENLLLFENPSRTPEKLGYVLSVIHSDLARAEAQEELNQRYTNYFLNNPYPSLLINSEGNILLANPAFKADYLYSPEELRKKQIWEILPNLDRLSLSNFLSKSGRSKKSVLAMKDGSFLSCRVDFISSGIKSHKPLILIVTNI